jgi:hypothetical protein
MADGKSLDPNAGPVSLLLDLGSDFLGHQLEVDHSSKRPSLFWQKHPGPDRCIRRQQVNVALNLI